MSQTVQRINLPSPGIIDAIKDTKQAAVFATLGLPFKSPGVFVTFDKENPKSSGGVAHFVFASAAKNSVGDLQQVWDEAKAELYLDEHLKDNPLLAKMVTDAVLVYCRRALENYRTLIHFIKTDAPEFVITGGEPVPGVDGARQAFTIKKIRKGDK